MTLCEPSCLLQAQSFVRLFEEAVSSLQNSSPTTLDHGCNVFTTSPLALQRRHDPFNGVRVGEASHPGPKQPRPNFARQPCVQLVREELPVLMAYRPSLLCLLLTPSLAMRVRVKAKAKAKVSRPEPNRAVLAMSALHPTKPRLQTMADKLSGDSRQRIQLSTCARKIGVASSSILMTSLLISRSPTQRALSMLWFIAEPLRFPSLGASLALLAGSTLSC